MVTHRPGGVNRDTLTALRNGYRCGGVNSRSSPLLITFSIAARGMLAASSGQHAHVELRVV